MDEWLANSQGHCYVEMTVTRWNSWQCLLFVDLRLDLGQCFPNFRGVRCIVRDF
jgi:hypothetical protein